MKPNTWWFDPYYVRHTRTSLECRRGWSTHTQCWVDQVECIEKSHYDKAVATLKAIENGGPNWAQDKAAICLRELGELE